MLTPLVMLRPCLLLSCLLALPAVASAQGVSARFSNQVATHGQDLGVQLLVDDSAGVVDHIQVELRRPLEAIWTATTAVAQAANPSGPQSWIATFPADQVWPNDNPPPSSVEVRALLYGRRGGLVLVVGEIEPFEMDALAPSRAAARTRALTRPTAAPQAGGTGADELSLAGYVGVAARAGSTGRARVFIAAGGPLTDTLELGALVIVGPSFAEPAGRDGGGPFVLGFEVDLRAYVWPLSDSTWNLFALPFVGLDMRLPGVDLLGGLRVGALYWVSTEVAVEASLGGGPIIFGVSSPQGETTELGFTGGLRLGVRFGPERK